MALMMLSPGAAAADTDPLGDLVGQIQAGTAPPAEQPAPPQAETAVDAPPTSSDSDVPGNETQDPTAPDHGSAKTVDGKIGTQQVAEIAGNNATVNDNDSTKADSTLLALGGQEVLGTHADSSTGQNESHFGDPLAPVCEGSGGQVCLRVLYADAYATDNGSASHSESRSGIASACIGGTSADPTAPCTGPIGVGAASSRGQADRNQNSGQTTASSMSDVAGLCLQPDPITGSCALGASALHSQGQADSGGQQASANRSSYLLGFDGGGQQLGRVEDPTDLSIQPACADPSLLCAFLNQGETYLGTGIAGHAQDALKATVLPGVLDIFAGVGHTETLVHNDGGNGDGPGGGGGPNDGGGDGGDGGGNGNGDSGNDVLPNTGGVLSGLLGLGLLSVAAGAFITAYGRRGSTLAV